MAIITEPEAGAVAPNSKTTVAESAGVAPVSKTAISEAAGVAPVSKTAIAAASGIAPTSKTTIAESSGIAPVSKTAVAAASGIAPVSKTTVTAAGFPRALLPLVDMHFDTGVYSQNGNPVLFADLFTYARSSNATFINRRTVNNRAEYFLDTDFVGNVENLLTFSEQFDNAAWTKTRSSIASNTIASPIGNITADSLIEDSTASNDHEVFQPFTTTASTVYNFSVYLKSRGRTQARIRNQDISGVDVELDIKSGSILSVGNNALTAKVEPMSNGWHRLSVSFNSGAGGGQDMMITPMANGSAIYNGDGVSGLYIWGAQLTESAKPLPYVKTLTVAVTETFSESLRIEYNPVTGENLGVLIEGASTNLALRSEELDNATWTKTRSSIAANATTAPDGTTSADNFIEDSSASATHPVTQSSISFTSGNSYTLTIFAKAKERTEVFLQLSIAAFPAAPNAFFDIAGGTVGVVGAGVDSSEIKNVGNGWFRCSITATSDATTSSDIAIRPSVSGSTTYSGDGSSGLYIWGAQVEQQPFATSYIRTEGSTVARVKDDLSLSSSSTFGGKSIFSEVSTLGFNSTTNGYFYSMGEDINNSVSLLNSSAGRARLFINNNSITQTDISSVFVLDDIFRKIFVNFTTNDIEFYSDSVLISSDSSSIAPDTTNMQIGSTLGASTNVFAHIRKLSVYNTTLTAQEVSLL